MLAARLKAYTSRRYRPDKDIAVPGTSDALKLAGAWCFIYDGAKDYAHILAISTFAGHRVPT